MSRAEERWLSGTVLDVSTPTQSSVDGMTELTQQETQVQEWLSQPSEREEFDDEQEEPEADEEDQPPPYVSHEKFVADDEEEVEYIQEDPRSGP